MYEFYYFKGFQKNDFYWGMESIVESISYFLTELLFMQY